MAVQRMERSGFKKAERWLNARASHNEFCHCNWKTQFEIRVIFPRGVYLCGTCSRTLLTYSTCNRKLSLPKVSEFTHGDKDGILPRPLHDSGSARFIPFLLEHTKGFIITKLHSYAAQ